MNASSLKMVLVQGDIIGKNVPENLNGWQKLLQKIPCDTQLIALPETFNTGFMNDPKSLAEPENGITFQWMTQSAKDLHAAICGSFMVKSNARIFNRFYFVCPDGNFRCYDKRHLFRFGGENDFLSEGRQRIIIEYLGWKILPLICYDLRFPVFAYNRWTETHGYEYDLMLVCANWPASRIKVWDSLLKARAIENQCYVAAVNRIGIDSNDIKYNGHSQIIDAKGNVKLKATQNKEILLFTELSYNRLKKFRKRFCTGADQD